jgi:hypothetical protein
MPTPRARDFSVDDLVARGGTPIAEEHDGWL